MSPTSSPRAFSLWLEFEEYANGYPQPDDDPTCDFCNATIRMNGKVCGLSIWTFGFIEHVRHFDEVTGQPKREAERFLLPPDLLVERLDRALIEDAIACQLQQCSPSPERWRWLDDEHGA